MSIAVSATTSVSVPRRLLSDRAATARVVMVAVIGAAAAASLLTGSTEAASRAAADAGPDLVRLLGFMAALKALMAAGAAAAVLWRLAAPITLGWFAAYALACSAMAAGPGLIFCMTHVGMGALLLHGGLAVTLVLLWRDPGVSLRLARAVKARRSATIG